MRAVSVHQAQLPLDPPDPSRSLSPITAAGKYSEASIQQLRFLEKLVSTQRLARDKFSGLELTHPSTTDLMVQLALSDGFSPATALDPAAGYGNFLYELAYQASGLQKIVACEADPGTAQEAAERLATLERQGIDAQVLAGDALLANWQEAFDLVICNPPYVRIHKLLATKAALRRRYSTLDGRFDLYFPFFELATRVLQPGGRLVIITSNKFMTTKAAGVLRSHIVEHFTPLRVLDFKDASPFRAAILACILVLERGAGSARHSLMVQLDRVAAAPNAAPIQALASAIVPPLVRIDRLGAAAVVARTHSGSIEFWNRGQSPWHLTDGAARSAAALLMARGRPLREFCSRFSVGIKTTADDVYIHPFDQRAYDQGLVERELLHPLLRGRSVRRWTVCWDPTTGYDRYVLYPHWSDDQGRTRPVNLEDFPLSRVFLESHRQKLEARSYLIEAGRRWYEIWVPQKPATLQAKRKLVFPDFAQHNTFALDLHGRFVGASAGFAIPKNDLDEHDCWYLLYLLNSPVIEYVHKTSLSTSILSKRYRYWTQHVERYPIPWPNQRVRQRYSEEAQRAVAFGEEPDEYLEGSALAFGLSSAETQDIVTAVAKWSEAHAVGP